MFWKLSLLRSVLTWCAWARNSRDRLGADTKLLCTRTSAHAHTHTHTCAGTHTGTHAHTHTHTCANTHRHARTHTYARAACTQALMITQRSSYWWPLERGGGGGFRPSTKIFSSRNQHPSETVSLQLHNQHNNEYILRYIVATSLSGCQTHAQIRNWAEVSPGTFSGADYWPDQLVQLSDPLSAHACLFMELSNLAVSCTCMSRQDHQSFSFSIGSFLLSGASAASMISFRSQRSTQM